MTSQGSGRMERYVTRTVISTGSPSRMHEGLPVCEIVIFVGPDKLVKTPPTNRIVDTHHTSRSDSPPNQRYRPSDADQITTPLAHSRRWLFMTDFPSGCAASEARTL